MVGDGRYSSSYYIWGGGRGRVGFTREPHRRTLLVLILISPPRKEKIPSVFRTDTGSGASQAKPFAKDIAQRQSLRGNPQPAPAGSCAETSDPARERRKPKQATARSSPLLFTTPLLAGSTEEPPQSREPLCAAGDISASEAKRSRATKGSEAERSRAAHAITTPARANKAFLEKYFIRIRQD